MKTFQCTFVPLNMLLHLRVVVSILLFLDVVFVLIVIEGSNFFLFVSTNTTTNTQHPTHTYAPAFVVISQISLLFNFQ